MANIIWVLHPTPLHPGDNHRDNHNHNVWDFIDEHANTTSYNPQPKPATYRFVVFFIVFITYF